MVNMTSPGRVQAPDLNLNTSLQPAPVVQAVAVQPRNPDGAGSNLLKIADSIASLGAPLSNFASVYTAQKQKTNNMQAQTDQYLPYDQALQRVQENPELLSNEAYQTMIGSSAANGLGPQIDKWTAEEWDASKEDYRTFLTRKMSEFQQTLPSDYAKASFGSQVTAWVDKAYANHMQDQAQTAEVQQSADVLSFYDGLIARGKMEKKTTDQIWADIVTASNDTRSFFGLSGQKQNDILIALAQKAAESGDKEMVDAILNGTRGADGKVPALSTIPDLVPKVEAIRNTANSKFLESHVNERTAGLNASEALSNTTATNEDIKAWDNKYRPFFSDSERTSILTGMLNGRDKHQLTASWAAEGRDQRTTIDGSIKEALLRGEGYQTFPTVEVNSDKTYGDTTKLDVNKRADELTNQMVDGLYQADPKSAPVRAAQFLAANNRTYSTWTSIFNAVTPQAINTAAAGGQLSEPIKKAVELYSQLHGQYDGVVERHITTDQKGTMSFLESYRILHEEFNMAPEAALAQVASHQGVAGDAVRGQAFGEVARAFNSMGSNLPDLSAHEAKDVMDMAVELSINTRLRGQDAIDRAWEQYQSTHTEVLGSWIPKNDSRIPPNIGEVMDAYAEDWVAAHGNQVSPPITDKEQIGVEWMNGQMVLTRKDSGAWIEMHNNRDQDTQEQGIYETVTMPKLSGYWNTRQKAALGEGYKNAAEDILGSSTGYGGKAPRYSAQNMFGVTEVSKVGTLNKTQLAEIVKLREAGKLPEQFTTPEFTAAIDDRLKKMSDLEWALINGLAH